MLGANVPAGERWNVGHVDRQAAGTFVVDWPWIDAAVSAVVDSRQESDNFKMILGDVCQKTVTRIGAL